MTLIFKGLMCWYMDSINKIPTLSVCTDISLPFCLKLAMSRKLWEAVITPSTEQKSPSSQPASFCSKMSLHLPLTLESSSFLHPWLLWLQSKFCLFLDPVMPQFFFFFCTNVSMAEFDQLDFNLPWFVTQFCQLSSLDGMENWGCFSPQRMFAH